MAPQGSRKGSSRFLVGLATAVVSLLAITSVFGDRGLLDVRQLQGKEALIRAEAEALEAENSKLRNDVKRLREDDAFLERVARESQGLVREGETVYRFPDR